MRRMIRFASRVSAAVSLAAVALALLILGERPAQAAPAVDCGPAFQNTGIPGAPWDCLNPQRYQTRYNCYPLSDTDPVTGEAINHYCECLY